MFPACRSGAGVIPPDRVRDIEMRYEDRLAISRRSTAELAGYEPMTDASFYDEDGLPA